MPAAQTRLPVGASWHPIAFRSRIDTLPNAVTEARNEATRTSKEEAPMNMNSTTQRVSTGIRAVEYRVSSILDATPEAVWLVIVDIARWPDMNSSYQELRRLDEGP